MAVFKNKLEVKIRLRLFLMIFLLSILPMISLLLYSQRSVFNLLISQSREYYNASLSRIVKNFEGKSADLTRVVRNLWLSKRFAETQTTKITDVQSELRIMRQLNEVKSSLDEKDIFERMFLADYGDIAIVHLNEHSAITGQTRVDYVSDEAFLVNVPILQEQVFYTDMSSVRESLVLNVVDSGVVVGRNAEHINVFFVPLFRRNVSDILVMILTKQRFWNDMFESEITDNSHLLYVTDKYDKVLWTNDKQYSDDANSILTDIDIHRIMHRLHGKSTARPQKSFARTKYHGINYMVFSESDLAGEAGFIMLVPVSSVTYSIRAYLRASILMMILLLALLVVSSLISGRVFARPIERHNDALQNENLYFMNLAHETKTPLTLIYNYLDKYIAEHGSSRELEIIRTNMEKINNNMLHFLDLGKIDRGQGTVSENVVTDVTSYLQDKADLYKITADKKGLTVTLSLQPNVFVRADVFSLDRILDNVFEDAVKFTDVGGKVDITLTKEMSMAVISIRDNGIGIDAKYLRHMFKPYHQLGGRRNEAGTGLGLYIIKTIIDSLGGSITANSVKGEGTEFIIRLPAASETQTRDSDSGMIIYGSAVPQPETVIADKPVSSSDMVILVVEDNDDLRHYLTGVLGRYYRVLDADNGETALQQLEQMPKPNLIISDVMMDSMNGFEFYERLRQRPDSQDIPFIFLSALNALPEKLRGLEIGAIDYIPKPFVIEELLAKIKSVLALQELKATLSEKDKYASLGILLGGISHEIFNPLAGIYGPLENLERIAAQSHLDDEEKYKFSVFADNIWTNIRRIESIIKSLKSLHYNKDMEIEPVSLHDTADTVINILMTKVKDRNITLSNNIGQEHIIRTSPGGMTQIMMNLISNAIDAIPQDADNGLIELTVVTNGPHTELRISDNGSGIPADKVDTIFNAFYSSKESGKGMGLGLYIVKNLIMKLNFDIKVESELGMGTTFRVIIK